MQGQAGHRDHDQGNTGSQHCSLRTCLEGNLRHPLGKGQDRDLVDFCEAIQAILLSTAWHFIQQHPTCVPDFSTLLRVARRCEIKSQMILSPIQAPTEGSSTYHLSERAHEFSQFIWDRSVLPGSSWVHLKSLIFNIYITQESSELRSLATKMLFIMKSREEELLFLKSWRKKTGMRRDRSSAQLQRFLPGKDSSSLQGRGESRT